jgi:hypothetical protein
MELCFIGKVNARGSNLVNLSKPERLDRVSQVQRAHVVSQQSADPEHDAQEALVCLGALLEKEAINKAWASRMGRRRVCFSIAAGVDRNRC